MDNEAQKHDTIKPRYDLLPPEALDEIVKVLTFGAGKYEDRNWEKGLTYGRCFAAAMRHLWVWWRGEDLDPESGLSHLAHAGCCVLFLLTYQLRKQADLFTCAVCGVKVKTARIGAAGQYCINCQRPHEEQLITPIAPIIEAKVRYADLDDRPGAKA